MRSLLNINVSENGNVGIGTTEAAAEKLEVAGTVKADAFIGDGSQLTGIETGKWSEGGDGLFYEGRVGIGTTEPGGSLHIRQSGDPQIVLENDEASGAQAVTLSFKQGDFTKTQIKAVSDTPFYNGYSRLGFLTADTERLTIHSNGNVGVGTTDPNGLLHVRKPIDPNVSLENAGVEAGQGVSLNFVQGGSVHTRIRAVSDAPFNDGYSRLGFLTAGTEQLTILSNGHVGIGTTNPETHRLHVEGTAYFADDITLAPGKTMAGRDLAADAARWDTAYDERRQWDGSESRLDKAKGRAALGLGSLATQDAGNVTLTGGKISGITPLALADGGTGASEAAAARINLGLGEVADLNVQRAWTQDAGHYIGTDAVRARDGGGLKLHDRDGNGLFVEDGGNVGVGTDNPADKLHVHNGRIKVSDGASGQAQDNGLDIALADGTDGHVWNHQNGRLVFATNDAERLRITNTGHVGIGKTDPEAALDVAGDIKTSGSVIVQQNLTIEGNFEVKGEVIARDVEHHRGSVMLGDEDSDIVTIHGVLRSAHSSDALRIDDAVRVHESVTIGANVDTGSANPDDYKLLVGEAAYFAGNVVVASGNTVDGRDLSKDGVLWDTAYAERRQWDGGAENLDQAKARAALGLSAMATQTADNVAISGGVITGIAPLAIADGGTGASDPETARANLGLDQVDNVNVREAWVQNEGQYIATDQLKARDTGGLALADKDGTGLFIEDGGNVGVGVSRPEAKLDVAGTVKAAAFVGDGAQLTGVIAGKWVEPGGETGAIAYTGGPVGIGTEEAAAPLDVVGNYNGSAATLRLQNRGDGETALGLFDKDGQLKGHIAYQPQHDTLRIHANGGSLTLGDGKIVVGGDGAIRLAGTDLMLPDVPDAPGFLRELYIDEQGKIYKQPQAFPGTPSSLRFKEDIQPLEANYNLLKAVPRTFTYKRTGEQSMGYLAEELYDLGLHHLVHCDQDNRPTSVAYDKVSIYALEIIKAQQTQLEKLERIVKRQKAKLSRIAKKVAHIE